MNSPTVDTARGIGLSPTLAINRNYCRRNQAAVDLVRERSHAPDNELRTLEHMTRFANGRAACYPGVPLLAKMGKVSERTIQRRIRKLEQRGELRVEERAGRACRHGHGRTNRYTILCLLPGYAPVALPPAPAPKKGVKVSPKVFSPSRSIPLPVPVLVPVKKNINSSNPTVGDRVTRQVSGGDSDRIVKDARRDARRRPGEGPEFAGGNGFGKGQANRAGLWTRILDPFRARMDPVTFRNWYPPAVRIGDVRDGVVWVDLPNETFRGFHQGRYDLTLEAVRAVLPDVRKVVFRVPLGEYRDG